MSAGHYGDGTCAAKNCERTIDVDMLMCREHWYEVPQALRSDVYEALRLWRRGNYTLGQLREVQDKAIASVTL